MPEISTQAYTRAYSFATNAVLEASVETSYPQLPEPERRALVVDILNSLAHRHGYRLAPLISLNEQDDGE